MKLTKLNFSGIAHYIIPLLVVVAVGAVGTIVFEASHAINPGAKPVSIKSDGCYGNLYGYQSTGVCVKDIQKILNYEVAAKLNVDGIYGPLTKSAVIKAQKTAGVTQDGIVGTNTWNVMCNGSKLLNSSYTKSASSSTKSAFTSAKAAACTKSSTGSGGGGGVTNTTKPPTKTGSSTKYVEIVTNMTATAQYTIAPLDSSKMKNVHDALGFCGEAAIKIDHNTCYAQQYSAKDKGSQIVTNENDMLAAKLSSSNIKSYLTNGKFDVKKYLSAVGGKNKNPGHMTPALYHQVYPTTKSIGSTGPEYSFTIGAQVQTKSVAFTQQVSYSSTCSYAQFTNTCERTMYIVGVRYVQIPSQYTP